jgi:hypothetical protein
MPVCLVCMCLVLAGTMVGMILGLVLLGLSFLFRDDAGGGKTGIFGMSFSLTQLAVFFFEH